MKSAVVLLAIAASAVAQTDVTSSTAVITSAPYAANTSVPVASGTGNITATATRTGSGSGAATSSTSLAAAATLGAGMVAAFAGLVAAAL